jgi:hypothetical protein
MQEKSGMGKTRLQRGMGVVLVILLAGWAVAGEPNQPVARRVPKDLSGVRGFNYTPALVEGAPRHHIDCWISYKESVIEFDLDLAKRLNLNQVRVFVPYQVYVEDRENLPRKLKHFVRACHERGIGVMPVVGYPMRPRPSQLGAADASAAEARAQEQAREWAAFLVKTLSDEPGLAFWDAMNEPDWPSTPPELPQRRCEQAKFMAGVFRELDPRTPVTIGMAFVEGMEKYADCVDVLQFHDYLQTRHQIRAHIERAKQFAAKVGKPLINGEIGCVARANPYDVTLQEHMDAHVGWYIWELMIVRKGWGAVHGVFYEDGTVRDPAIAAAVLGFFRNRGQDVLPEAPDREGWVTKVVTNGNKWLAQSDASWDEGLDLAETAANLLESAQLVPMRELPTRQVAMLRKGQPDLPALRGVLGRYIEILKPYQQPRQP